MLARVCVCVRARACVCVCACARARGRRASRFFRAKAPVDRYDLPPARP